MDISIRPYRDSDLDAVASIWHTSWESTGVALEQNVSLEVLRERFPQEIADKRIVYVATIGTDIVAFISMAGNRLEQLFVAPERQNLGIGKTLLDFVKTQMPDGFDLITAVESRAPRFYEREGMKRGEESRHPEYGHRIVRYIWRQLD